eukprot:9105833-Pyramimonas_sp.AAC.1
MDVICVQETHGQVGDLSALEKDYQDFQVFGSFVEDAHAGGIVFLVRKTLISLFDSVSEYQCIHGRILSLTLVGSKGILQLSGLHLDPDWSEGYNRNVLSRLSRHLLP